ncbi:DMT family transporter [Aminobacter sp. AP02]|uniref:DMT family transporter n=1 Tax=Aminobacter sp. AP02 TaxID=2135737 RepID=UPI000D6B21A9|nr:DMT family transporter [Aminobacter sp. AP02]PWK68534.1 putative membrane protein [Aminobacter sp. AP02]
MTRLHANALLFLAAFCWGVGNVAQKTVLDDLGPILAMGLRGMIALIVVAPFLWRETKSSAPPTGGQWRALAKVSVFFLLALASQQLAYGGTSVTNASFLVNTTVVFTPVFAWLMLRERPDLVLVPSVGLAVCGILLMSGGLGALRWGDAACVASAVLYSVWIVLVANVARAFDRPFIIAGCQFCLAGFVGITFGLIFENISWQALAAAAPELAMLGVISTGLAYTLQAVAQRHTSPSHSAIIMSAESIFGAAAASMLLGERMNLMNGVGAATILASIILLQVPAQLVFGKRLTRLAAAMAYTKR